jgi:hypothetical protein
MEGRITHVAAKEIMLELATSVWDKFKSFLMVTDKSGGKAYLCTMPLVVNNEGVSFEPYQDQKAIKKPHQPKKKTRP